MDKREPEHRYVTAVGLNDVQLGRGRPVVTSEGNQHFRALILQHKPEYIASNRHAHKDTVARKILAIITERGGKFLRKIESSDERKNFDVENGIDVWEIADDITSINKVKQALRENESPVTSAEATSGRFSITGKTKKVINNAPSAPPVASRKRNADSKSNPESMKNKKQKKKRERQVDIPVSLAESIRSNASKLGTDFSLFDPPYSPLDANVTTSVPPDERNSNARPTILRHCDHSSNVRLLGNHLASATSFTDDLSSVYLSRSEKHVLGSMHESACQGRQESLNPPVIAVSIAEFDTNVTVNNSIRASFAPSDSRRVDIPVVHESAENVMKEKEGTSSDEDKKPAAL